MKKLRKKIITMKNSPKIHKKLLPSSQHQPIVSAILLMPLLSHGNLFFLYHCCPFFAPQPTHISSCEKKILSTRRHEDGEEKKIL